MTHSIAKAIVLKHGNLFFLTPPEGEVPFTRDHGYGLYYHDCRYLNGYELLFGDEHPESLAAQAAEGGRAVFQLTTPDFCGFDGRTIHRETVGLKWERIIDSDLCVLHERLEIQNFGYEPIAFPLVMRFRAGFEDVFEIRGLIRERKGSSIVRIGRTNACVSCTKAAMACPAVYRCISTRRRRKSRAMRCNLISHCSRMRPRRSG